jgi:hypothetical protein
MRWRAVRVRVLKATAANARPQKIVAIPQARPKLPRCVG